MIDGGIESYSLDFDDRSRSRPFVQVESAATFGFVDELEGEIDHNGLR